MTDTPEKSAPPELPLPPKPPRWPAVAAVLALLMALGVVAIGHFYWQGMQASFALLRQAVERAKHEQQAMVAQLDEATRGFTEQQLKLQEQEQRLHEQVVAISRQQERLAQDKRRLTQQEETVRQTLENLHAEVDRSARQWRAAEAAYLIEVAARRLSLEQDADTALQALRSAVERLNESGDPQWLPVRESLEADMLSLAEVEAPDLSPLSQALVRMQTGINRLPLKSPDYKSGNAKPPNDPEAEDSQRDLDNLLREGLSGLQSPRMTSTQRAPTLPKGPQDSYSVRQNLRLQLDAARFALLRGDRELYEASLDTARTWLTTFFRAESPETGLYLHDWTSLQTAPIEPEFPDLTPTLEMLRAKLDSKQEEP